MGHTDTWFYRLYSFLARCAARAASASRPTPTATRAGDGAAAASADEGGAAPPTTLIGLPSRKACTLSATSSMRRWRVSTFFQPMCGVSSTFSSVKSGEFAGGGSTSCARARRRRTRRRERGDGRGSAGAQHARSGTRARPTARRALPLRPRADLHVERGAREASRLERGAQRGLVDDRAARLKGEGRGASASSATRRDVDDSRRAPC